MTIQIFRWPREIWIWKHGTGLRPIHVGELIAVFKPALGKALPNSVLAMDLVGWNGTLLEFKSSYTSLDGELLTDHTATLCWDSATNKVRLIQDKVDRVGDSP